MAAPTTTSYQGPRTLSNDATTMRSELERVIKEIERVTRELARGQSRRWLFRPEGVVRPAVSGPTSVSLLPNVQLEIDTSSGNTAIVILGTPDTRDIGLECGICRLSAAGTITLTPISGATLNGSTATAALSATAGDYVLVITPRGYWLRR